MEQHLLFFDIDGTLLFRNKEYSEKNVDALLRLKAAGHKIFINSGRSRSIIPDILTDRIPFDGFVCGSTYVECGGEVLHRVIMDDDTIRAACRYAKENGWKLLLECEKSAYGINGGCFHDNTDITDVLEEYLEEPSNMLVTKLTFGCDVPHEVSKDFHGIRIINFGGFAEGIASGYDKAYGMKLLGKKFNVPRERIVAFGDSVNDNEMLRYAGKSVVMKSAPAAYDEFVTYRADSDFEGVADGINKLFFGEQKL